ncbi:hypothetical protein CSUB01_12085, partial [Colletotrichum sublineola]
CWVVTLRTLRAGGNLRASPPAALGRPRAITDAEDAALAAYIIWLENAGFPAIPIELEETANYLRSLRGMPAVSEHFVRTFIADHPELQHRRVIKPVELCRRGAELDPVPIEDFFERYRGIIRDYDLGPSEIWNADETGCRIGCLGNRIHVIVLQRPPRYNRAPEVVDPANRESSKLQRMGYSLGDYFGSDAYGRTTYDLYLQDGAPSGRSLEYHNYRDTIEKSKRPHRLLLLDGFTGHMSIKLMEYTTAFDIILGFLPPHITHFLQPMDVGVFQPFKGAQQKVLRGRFVTMLY